MPEDPKRVSAAKCITVKETKIKSLNKTVVRLVETHKYPEALESLQLLIQEVAEKDILQDYLKQTANQPKPI